ncbi:hypothetical protein C8A03DRAFT_39415 [Achaetomium macrosporum]|uniref:Uncharacterized protein n=1 Tax=Achaetomium macrosporum TaxID=79813 RepID=A0AAN7C0D1_9PEZI|nr:hypothetical protein C8A03DRAFT_39415 [Achaetomium macrosporum]
MAAGYAIKDAACGKSEEENKVWDKLMCRECPKTWIRGQFDYFKNICRTQLIPETAGYPDAKEWLNEHLEEKKAELKGKAARLAEKTRQGLLDIYDVYPGELERVIQQTRGCIEWWKTKGKRGINPASDELFYCSSSDEGGSGAGSHGKSKSSNKHSSSKSHHKDHKGSSSQSHKSGNSGSSHGHKSSSSRGHKSGSSHGNKSSSGSHGQPSGSSHQYTTTTQQRRSRQ